MASVTCRRPHTYTANKTMEVLTHTSQTRKEESLPLRVIIGRIVVNEIVEIVEIVEMIALTAIVIVIHPKS